MSELEWQPIETAPRDGTEIIALLGGHAVSARWLDNEPGYIGAGWVTLESRECFVEAGVPDGWMPLPPPPPVTDHYTVMEEARAREAKMRGRE